MAHTDDDVEKVSQSIVQGVKELQAVGFLTDIDRPVKNTTTSNIEKEKFSLHLNKSFPLTEAQQEIWIASKMTLEANRVYNESFSIQLKGALNVPILVDAIEHVFHRHEALHLQFSTYGDAQEIVLKTMPITRHSLVDLTANERTAKIKRNST